ncbi:amidohydrolase family protein [Phycisphaerales bacterium AB-hyl4]|uniref:Amidohydrolase family protein n=1 Tax=Natronomicrosphaera hydrolytica TaxID=3242702 RepID=A0ABV4U7H9_9BACT
MSDGPTFFDAFTRYGPKPFQHGAQPWRLEHLIEEMDHCSISGALVTSTACTLYDPMRGNLELVETLAPYDHLFPLWNVMPHWTGEMPEPEALTALRQEYAVAAVTLSPTTNGWRIPAATSRPLLDELQRTATLTILDMRDAGEADVEYLVEAYPKLPILMVGLGWSRQRWALPMLLHHRNLHVAFDHFQINCGLEWLAQRGCEDQLVYASNATDMSMGAHRCYVDYADVSDDVRAKVAGGNLVRLLHGVKPPRVHVNGREDELMTAGRRGEPLPTPVLDMHTHILDEGLNGAGGAYTMFEGGPAGVARLARRMGVDAMGMMSWHGPVATFADDGNRCVRAALDAMPDDYWGLGTFDVVHDSPEQMRRNMEACFADPRMLGLKPYPHYGKHYDHPDYEPWWHFGEEHGLYALLHVNRQDLSEIDALAPAWPGLTFVVAHCGSSYVMADHAIRVARAWPNVMLEITLTPVCMGIVDHLVNGAGADRVVYGSDLPMRDPRQQMGWVVFSRLGLEAKRQVLGLNARGMIDAIRRRRRSAVRP